MIEVNENFWKISQFANILSERMSKQYPDNERMKVHYNTVDGWFKDLELKGIHYVNRKSGQKVYDSLDLLIGEKIMYYRYEKNFNLDMIHELLVKGGEVELRPFPPEEEISNLPKSYQALAKAVFNNLLSDIKNEVETQVAKSLEKDIMQQKMAAVFTEIAREQATKAIEENRKLLPSKEEERANRINLLLTEHKIKKKLENEAINAWNELPENERLVKVGLFRKQEDFKKRDLFIRDYINKHYERAIKEEFGLDE